MKWKDKLKSVLAEAAKPEKNVICLEKALTKTDETKADLVLSVFVSDELRDISEKTPNLGIVPICSNCGLQMNLIENGELWFCPLGCESRNVN